MGRAREKALAGVGTPAFFCLIAALGLAQEGWIGTRPCRPEGPLKDPDLGLECSSWMVADAVLHQG